MKYKVASILAMGCICSIACKKSDSSVDFSTISPSVSRGGDTVTIVGSGFSSNIASDVVTFNGKTGTVISASGSEIKAVVPLRAGSGTVIVTVNGHSSPGVIYGYDTVGVVTTLAGGNSGSADGVGKAAQFNGPMGICIDGQGNLYVADEHNSAIRKITQSGAVTTLAGGANGHVDGAGSAAKFNVPMGIAVNAQGILYVADFSNSAIRSITPAGVVSTLAGSATYETGYVDGPGSAARFSTVSGICLDSQGNIYVADGDNARIRKITPDGTVSTLAGNGLKNYVDGAGTAAAFNYPGGVYYDAAGNQLLVSDHLIARKVSLTGAVTTITTPTSAGPQPLYLSWTGMCMDAAGNMYTVEVGGNVVAMTNPAGVTKIIAGSSTLGAADGKGKDAQFSTPTSICMDAQGTLYVTDGGNNSIRKVVVQ